MEFNENRDKSRLIFEQELRKFQSISEWDSIHIGLKRAEKKIYDNES